jgi:hypothetical protein
MWKLGRDAAGDAVLSDALTTPQYKQSNRLTLKSASMIAFLCEWDVL